MAAELIYAYRVTQLPLLDADGTIIGHLEDIGAHVLAFQANVESWFNDSMARVGGWYKRWRDDRASGQNGFFRRDAVCANVW